MRTALELLLTDADYSCYLMWKKNLFIGLKNGYETVTVIFLKETVQLRARPILKPQKQLKYCNGRIIWST